MYNLADETTDEISDYQNNKYLGSNEAAAIILGLKTGGLQPPVETLSLHLPNEQSVIYNASLITPESHIEVPILKFAMQIFCRYENLVSH